MDGGKTTNRLRNWRRKNDNQRTMLYDDVCVCAEKSKIKRVHIILRDYIGPKIKRLKYLTRFR